MTAQPQTVTVHIASSPVYTHQLLKGFMLMLGGFQYIIPFKEEHLNF